jgi:hypothetical protein
VPGCSRGTLADLVKRQVFLVSGDLPNVAGWISDGSTAVAIMCVARLLERDGARFERAPICRIDIVEVEIQKRWHRLAPTGLTDHYNRIADSDLRGAVGSENPGGAERVLEEANQLRPP